MRRSIAVVLLLLAGLWSLTAAAQQLTGTVRGQVLDASRQPVPFATVVLRQAENLKVAKIALTDVEGAYELPEVTYGRYSLLITSVGFQDATPEPFDLNQPQHQQPALTMLTAQTLLGEVQVVAKKPLVERQLDRTVVNVDASITSAGSSVLEVLEKSPGVSVDKDGNLGLRGKEGVSVYLDGRPTYLTGSDLAALLRSMQASQVNQVEIMTNPSAKYDAAGNGVINITTAKSQLKGLSGSATSTYTQGRYAGAVQNLNLNYRSGPLTLYSSLGAGLRNGYQEFLGQRRLRGATPDTALYQQNTFMKTHNRTFNGRVGVDYALGEKTVIGASVNGYHNPNHSTTRNLTRFQNAAGQDLLLVQAPASSRGRWQNLGGTLSLQQKLDTTGRELSADLAYVQYHSQLSQDFTNSYRTAGGEAGRPDARFRQGIDRRIAIYTAKADYLHPLGENRKLELGLKASYVRTDNDAPFDNWLSQGWVANTTRSNRFLYEENINAGYANYSQETGKWSVQLGLRLENTRAEGEQRRTGQAFTRDYTQLFPSAAVAYTLGETHKLGVSYARRIERPEYGDLNPFRVYLDPYTYEEGNPGLLPQFTHNAELSHSFKDGLLTTTLLYNRTTNIIQEVFGQDGSFAFERPENLSTRVVRGVSVSAEVPVSELITSSFDVQLTHNRYAGQLNDQPFSLEATTLKGNMLHQAKLDNGWGLELAGWYTSRSIAGTFIQQPYGMLALGASKAVLGKRGTLRLSATDLFGWNRFVGVSRYQDVDVTLRNNWQTRQVKLTFTYRFNKGLKVAPRTRQSASEEENNRVGAD
ncbi:TonB-dependent receptor domain-containing protein [Hymenobacter sp. B81]|uniref:TonB-dependent receptor domain-containing protein n=1 Tax=Hymenobacter sp. B81 TaxID=3344878 RepID=UPI0037DCC548